MTDGDPRSNVILLVVDSLRRDYVDKYADDSATVTPNIMDHFDEVGTTYDRCFSNSTNTPPCTSALLTSQYPLDGKNYGVIDSSRVSVAELFSAAGYETAAFHSNPLLSRENGFDRGFDTYRNDILPASLEKFSGLFGPLAPRLNKIVRLARKLPYLPAADLNQKATDWITGREDPFFLWLQYMDVHGPYLDRSDSISRVQKAKAEVLWQKAVRTPEEITREEHEQLLDAYESEVSYVDTQIGHLIDRLAGMGELEDTIIVLTADHGEQFREHGNYTHGDKPYDELIEVPLFVRGPGVGSDDVSKSVEHVDVAPTLLDLTGVDSPDMNGTAKGTPLSERDRERVRAERKVANRQQFHFGIRDTEWKFIDIRGDTGTGRELYDLTRDPGETENRASEEPDVLAEFEESLERRLASINSLESRQEYERDRDVDERLESLGYIE